MKKVSLVVPIYNVEKYLENCLLSIVNQTFNDIEVILVNDGSTDGSLRIANEFCEKNNQFTLISQENRGLSGARNRGLSIATGEYVAFIDSDDTLHKDYVKKLYQAAAHNDADIAMCGFQKYWIKSGIIMKRRFRKRSGVYAADRLLHNLIKDVFVQNYVWNKLYRRSLFTDNNIIFPKMRFEDIGTVPRLFFYSKKIVIIPDFLYNYTKRENSILAQRSSQNLNDYVKAFCMLRIFLSEQNSFDKYKKTFEFCTRKVSIISYLWTVLLHVTIKQMGIIDNFKRLRKKLKKYSAEKVVDYSDLEEVAVLIREVKI